MSRHAEEMKQKKKKLMEKQAMHVRDIQPENLKDLEFAETKSEEMARRTVKLLPPKRNYYKQFFYV